MTLPQDSLHPFALAFSPCGGYLASGAWWVRGLGIKKCPVLLWDVKTGEKIADFRWFCEKGSTNAFLARISVVPTETEETEESL